MPATHINLKKKLQLKDTLAIDPKYHPYDMPPEYSLLL